VGLIFTALAGEPPVVTIARHAVELFWLFLILVAPLPLALVLGAGPARRSGASHALLTVLVTWTAMELAVALLLGTFGSLDLPAGLTVEGTLLGLGVVLALRRNPRPAHLVPNRPPAAAEWPVVLALTVLGASLLLRLAAEPITDHDSLGYHLPALARWVQTGALLRPERTNKVAYYPYDWEALCSLFVLPFHEDFLVALPNLVAWVVLGLAVLRAGIAIGASRFHALAAAFFVLATPLVRHQVTTMHVDLPLAAFFAAGLSFALAHAATGSRIDLAMFVTTLGLVAGIKTTGLVFAAMLVGAFVLMHRTGRAQPASESSGLPLVMIGPALLAGGFWYVRNLADIGNPIGLVRVTLFGWTLFPGRIEPATLWGTTLAGMFDPRRVDHWRVLGTLRGQLQLPCLLLAVASLGLVRRPRPVGRELQVVLLLLLGTAAAYVTTPYSAVIGPGHTELTSWMGENLRYALPFIALLGVTGSLGATRVAGPALVLLGVLAVFLEATNPWMPAAVALLATAALAVSAQRRTRSAAFVALLGVLVLVVAGSLWLRTRRDLERHRLYDPVPRIVAQALPTGGAVGYVTPVRSYLLYGPHFTNRVVYVSPSGDDRDTWVQMLRERGVALVVLGPLASWQRQEPVIAWLADPGGPFQRIGGENPARETVVYRLR
jgi:hypothetical protein